MALATCSLFLALTRSGGRTACRALSSIVTAASDAGATAFPASDSSTSRASDRSMDELRSQVFGLRFPKSSATNLLQKWVAEGNPVTLPELRRLAKDLNRAQRYKHALEIWTWMEARGCFKVLGVDCSFTVGLNLKVHRVLEAEKFFYIIPDRSSKKAVCIPLLRYYVKQREK